MAYRHKITIVTNHPARAAALSRTLNQENYETATVTARAGKQLPPKTAKGALILLDVTKPRKHRAALASLGNAPIIILSKTSKLNKTLSFLEAGAVDHVAKPYNPDNLLSAIGGYFNGEPPSYWPKDIAPGELILDRLRRTAVVEANVVKLTKVEFELLRLMFELPGAIVLYCVFKDNIAPLTTNASKKAIDGHMKTLGKKLKNIGFKGRIEKDCGAGYGLKMETRLFD